jgi:hypothetical protein
VELMLAVLILVALIACWFVLPAEKPAAHHSAPAAPSQVSQRA